MGALFAPDGFTYGDTRARWDNWAGHAEVGYTFDVKCSPRVFVGGAYYQGEDRRDISFREWLNPFSRSEASVSFNRLFSSWREDAFIDASAMSNFLKAYAGATLVCNDAIEVGGNLSYYQVDEPFEQPAYLAVRDWRIPVAPALSFWSREGSKDLGSQLSLWLSYAYSEDLSFEVGWSHFFTGQAINDGSFIDGNGLTFVGGLDDEDADYVYFLTTLEF